MVSLGAESGDPDLLRELKAGVTLDQVAALLPGAAAIALVIWAISFIRARRQAAGKPHQHRSAVIGMNVASDFLHARCVGGGREG